MIVRRLVRTLAVASVIACQAAPTAPPQASSYHLAFSDNFDTLGIHKWYQGVWFNHQHAPAKNITAANSVLTLRWRAGQTPADTDVSSFSPGGSPVRSWRYGYFEARMKWDVVTGAWPAFWLIPVEDAEGLSTHNGFRESGEIDIFEGQGDHPHTYYGTVHDWVNLRSTANEDNHFTLPDAVDLSQYHVYGMLWAPGVISWYLDDRLLHTERAPAILDQEHMFLVFSMQEGADWKLGDTSGVTQPRMDLNIDWVRVWQK